MTLRPCLDCGKPAAGTRCPAHKAQHAREREARRGTPSQRGLDASHRRQVAALKREAGPITCCPRCGRPITPANPISGEHAIARAHGGTEVTGLICRSCNSSAGATVRRT